MKHTLILVLIASLFTNQSCVSQNTKSYAPVPKSELQGLSKAYFASGCFWCVEAIFERVIGVKEVYSGYAGGQSKNPTYQAVGSGNTGHTESIEVYYDPEIVGFETLVDVFYGSQDPTTVGQAPDFGDQYRSAIFYTNAQEKAIAEAKKEALEKSGAYAKPIVTEIAPLDTFYIAEEYHQDFERRNPTNSYVRNVSIPRLKRFQKKFPDLIKD